MTFISTNMAAVLGALDSNGSMSIEEIPGNTLAALLARDAVDFVFDGRRRKYNVRVRLTSSGKNLNSYARMAKLKPYKDCLAERRKHIPKHKLKGKRQASASASKS